MVVFGATSTQIVLSSPLYTSSKHESRDVGIILQRTLILGNLGILPVICMWWYMEPLMLALHQPPSLAAALGVYMRYYALGQPGLVLMEAAKSYMQVQCESAALPSHVARHRSDSPLCRLLLNKP